MILGSAGQRIITAGEILCLAGLFAGLRTTQKNEYNITVLRGPSITDVLLSPHEIGYTGIRRPDVVLALSQEGVARRRGLFDFMDSSTLIIRAPGVVVPSCKAKTHNADFKSQKLKSPDWALAALAVLAKMNRIIHTRMLTAALNYKFKNKVLASALDVVERVRMN
jgi:Pyruvate/2-oxoacid:ferredoxin oxidoreductase gamma subunit